MQPTDTHEPVVAYRDYLEQVMRVATLENELQRVRELLTRHQREIDEINEPL